jgi:hypothetical protein
MGDNSLAHASRFNSFSSTTPTDKGGPNRAIVARAIGKMTTMTWAITCKVNLEDCFDGARCAPAERSTAEG